MEVSLVERFISLVLGALELIFLSCKRDFDLALSGKPVET
jgi:hypothetical protein